MGLSRVITLKGITVAIISIFSGFTQAEILVTPSSKASIVQLCEEGEVSCGTVHLKLFEQSSKATLRAIGKALHSKCSDGFTLCSLQGWEFYNREGKIFIFITPAGKVTMINRRGEVTFEEFGSWQ